MPGRLNWRLIGLAAVVVIVIIALIMGIRGCMGASAKDADETPAAAAPAAPTGSGVVSFVAVGDNLPNERIGYYADAVAGEENDGLYDYRSIYAPIKPYIEGADLAYVDQETHIGGDEIGPRGWPSFNTTDAMADAIVDTGFDLVASATNHSYDWGPYGAIEHSLSIWSQKPVAFTGTAVTAEQYNTIPVVERNGIKFSLLNYTYGVNGYEQSELPQYAVNFIDEDRIAADVARAHEQSDVVLVAMHWGTELLMEADETQQHLAQFLANLDVDMVLGSHPHVIGPVVWLENANGNGHKTLVAYSLGNFLADHDNRSPEVDLEGMISCTFVRGEDGNIAIEDPVWTPLLSYTNEDRTVFRVYAVKDLTADVLASDPVFESAGIGDAMAWLRDTSANVVGGAIPQDVEPSTDEDADSAATGDAAAAPDMGETASAAATAAVHAGTAAARGATSA